VARTPDLESQEEAVTPTKKQPLKLKAEKVSTVKWPSDFSTQ